MVFQITIIITVFIDIFQLQLQLTGVEFFSRYWISFNVTVNYWSINENKSPTQLFRPSKVFDVNNEDVYRPSASVYM